MTRPDSSNDPLLSELERVDAQALDALRQRMAGLETDALAEAQRSFARYEKQFEDLLRRMGEAKAAFEANADQLHAKLVVGPVDEDELRARMVILDLEYGSRMRLAEEGFRMLRESFEEHLDEERARARGFADNAHAAIRERVQAGRGKVVEVFEKRDELVKETRAELARLRRELDDARRKGGAAAFPLDISGVAGGELAEALRERDRQLTAARAHMQQLEAKLERLAKRAESSTAAEEKIAELEAALEARSSTRAPVIPDQTFLQLRDRLKDAVAARAEAQGALHKLRTLLRESQNRLGEREAEILALKKRPPDPAPADDDEMIGAPPRLPADPLGQSVERARMHDVGQTVDRLRRENADLKKRFAETLGSGFPAADVSALQARVAELERELAERPQADPPADPDKTQVIDGELTRARVRIRELEDAASAAPTTPESEVLKKELDAVRKKLRAAETAKDLTEAKAEEAEEALQQQRVRMKDVQKSLLGADVTRDKRFDEERSKWDVEKEEIEEKMLQAQREYKTLKLLHEQSERDWEETLTKQDAKRMQEIFKLRAQLQQQKWKTVRPPEEPPNKPESAG